METPTPSSFAERLTSVVEASGMSRAAFARAIEVGDTTLKNYMMGDTEPGVTELLKIADVGNVFVNWLVTGEGPRNALQLNDSVPPHAIDIRYMYSRELIIEVVKAMEEELAAAALSPSPAKRADLLIAFLYLFKRYNKVDPDQREAIRMMIGATS